MATPLAWQNLTHDRKRLGWAVAGIGFAVLLMFMQLGFRGALFDSTVELPRLFDADLVLVNPQRYMLTIVQKFPRRYLQVAEGHPAVESADPLYVENIRATWKQTDQPLGPPIRVMAFNPERVPLKLPEVVAQADKLQRPDTGLFDRRSKSDFGEVKIGDIIELAGHRVEIVGEFSLGTDFADDGSFIVSDRTFNKAFYADLPDSEGLKQVDLGLIRLRHGSDAAAVRAEIERSLPADVLVMTKDQYVEFELSFWRSATPIGYVFALGTAMGFIVGTIICYQILFSDIADHLKEFATLKAMGYRPKYFMKIVLQESVLLSAFGFGPGLIAALALYKSVAAVTGLPMNLDLDRILMVLLLTTAMCVVAGVMTMRKVLTTDPAELF
jgi:putative ABC transport system permease protein